MEMKGRKKAFLPLCLKLILFVLVFDQARARKNILNVSRDPPVPLFFWPIQNTKIAVGLPGKRYASINGGSILDTGPEVGLHSILFSPAKQTGLTMSNSDGEINGDDAMCWLFHIYTTDLQQNAILMTYKGSGPQIGFTLKLVPGGFLQATVVDSLGNPFTFTSTFTIAASAWNFVGVNFNSLWDYFDMFDIIKFEGGSPVFDTFTLDVATTTIDTKGDIRFGSGFDGSQGFEGQMACLQFYNTSIIGGTQADTPLLCDPALWVDPDYGDYTELLDTPGEPSTESRCMHMTLTGQNMTYATLLQSTILNHPHECARLCLKSSSCVGFSYLVNQGQTLCNLGQSNATVLALGHSLFTL